MKKTLLEIRKEFGIDKLTIGQSIIMFWCAFAFCLMLCCDYENSAWYAMPVLVGHFALSAFFANKFIPKSFWDMADENDIEI